jgi:hypothetical protein
MKSAMLERQLGHHDVRARVLLPPCVVDGRRARTQAEYAMLKEGVEKYPTFPKLWLMMSQYFTRQKPPHLDQAEETFKNAVKHCPNDIDLWINYVEASCFRGRACGVASVGGALTERADCFGRA